MAWLESNAANTGRHLPRFLCLRFAAIFCRFHEIQWRQVHASGSAMLQEPTTNGW